VHRKGQCGPFCLVGLFVPMESVLAGGGGLEASWHSLQSSYELCHITCQCWPKVILFDSLNCSLNCPVACEKFSMCIFNHFSLQRIWCENNGFVFIASVWHEP
jgi:hypothetical protein